MLTLVTAFITPLPCRRSPPSRNSTASRSPVEAPDGTSARPNVPSDNKTSASTVGLPRESNTSRALIFSIVTCDMMIPPISVDFFGRCLEIKMTPVDENAPPGCKATRTLEVSIGQKTLLDSVASLLVGTG